MKTWTFASDSNPSRTFTTTLRDDGTRHCTCHGAKFLANGSVSCKHTRLIDQGVADEVAISFSGTAPQNTPSTQSNINPIQIQHTSPSQEATPVAGGIILPQLLTAVDEAWLLAHPLLSDKDWGAQEKIDGKRILIKADGNGITAFNRKGLPCEVSPLLLEELSQHGTFILDGEWIESEGYYYVFDILDLDGSDLTNHSCEERHAILRQYLNSWNLEFTRLVPLATTTKDKKALFDLLKSNGREGIVFKELASGYDSGRHMSQLKFKFYETVSCIVTSHSDQKSKATGKKKSSVSLGLYESSGKNTELIPVGNCTIPAGWDLPDIGTVVEIRYLYAYKGGSLYQPTFLMERDDVGPDSLENLKFKSEAGGILNQATTPKKTAKKTTPTGPARRVLWKD